jgi:hypothetical protein
MDINTKSIWKITASVSAVLMVLTLGVSAVSACHAEESPADLNQNSPFPGDYDQNCPGNEVFPLPTNEIVSCNGNGNQADCAGENCDGCIEAGCSGDCCEKCNEVCGQETCTGECCEKCTGHCDEADSEGDCALTECKGDCCENSVKECGQACYQESCAGNSEETCHHTDCTAGSKQSTCSK